MLTEAVAIIFMEFVSECFLWQQIIDISEKDPNIAASPHLVLYGKFVFNDGL